MFQTKKYDLIKTGNYVLDKGYIFLLIILVAYAVMVVKNYLILPCWSDNIWYVGKVNSPGASAKLFFRFFNYYVTKIMIGSFLSPLKGCALFSLLYHLGIVTFSYLIALRIAGKTSPDKQLWMGSASSGSSCPSSSSMPRRLFVLSFIFLQ